VGQRRRFTTHIEPCFENIGKAQILTNRDEDYQKTAYQWQNTLLEPNNVVPSWEFGGEEAKEVSVTMRNLRAKYDSIHKVVLTKEKELNQLRVSLRS
jgi:hypothetical protein